MALSLDEDVPGWGWQDESGKSLDFLPQPMATGAPSTHRAVSLRFERVLGSSVHKGSRSARRHSERASDGEDQE